MSTLILTINVTAEDVRFRAGLSVIMFVLGWIADDDAHHVLEADNDVGYYVGVAGLS